MIYLNRNVWIVKGVEDGVIYKVYGNEAAAIKYVEHSHELNPEMGKYLVVDQWEAVDFIEKR